MQAVQLSIDAFRNLVPAVLRPAPGVNLIYGENGQGKTNLLEALWLFSGAKSFRGARDGEYIPLDGQFAAFSLEYRDSRRENQVILKMGEKKKILLNGVEESSRMALAGGFCCVAFAPPHLNIIKGAPAERRRFLDLMIGQAKPRYLTLMVEYQRLLNQRNALLRDIAYAPALADTLSVWDGELARVGARIVRIRASAVQKLQESAAAFYEGISSGREQLTLRYHSSIGQEGEGDEQTMLSLLQKNLPQDMRLRATTVGPHRDDLAVELNDISARAFGSQGQQRSAVLALKLGECALLEETLGEAPVVLLDDVMSELDALRRDYLLHRLQGRQIFITSCDPDRLNTAGASFFVKEGVVTPA